jgi:hypothetical protein
MRLMQWVNWVRRLCFAMVIGVGVIDEVIDEAIDELIDEVIDEVMRVPGTRDCATVPRCQ